MVIVESTYQDPITISATRLDGPTPVEFIGPSQFILLPPNGGPTGWPLSSVTADGWRSYIPAIQMPLDATGCYAIDFTGPGLSKRITFWAELDPAGRTVVASEPPVCGPPPPLLKPPTDGPGYLRVGGRTYLSGVAFQAPGPTLSVDPSLVGREIGRVKWNIDDPDIDFCHADLDGASSALEPGTSIHAHQGYREDFRVVAETPYGWRIFESDWRDGANTAEELLDIRGKVVSIDVQGRTGGDPTGERWAVADPGDVGELVARLLDEPITLSSDIAQFGEPGLSFTFQLDDSTRVTRFWFAGPRPYSSGIPVSEAFLDEITALLEQSQ
jgi:hypothetical protein